MKIVWRKLHATWQSQGSFRTRILGNLIRIQYISAIWNPLKRKDCCLRQGRMQSFSTTHYQLFAWRKWYVWRQRMRSSKRYAWLREYRGLYWDRTRKLVHKINKNRTQEHLVTNQANQNCPGKVGATPWITEFLMYLWFGGRRLVGKGHHRTSLHTPRADTQAQDLSLFLFVFFFQSTSVSFCRIMMYVDDSCGEFHTQRREKPSRVLCPQHTGHHFRDLLAEESGEGLAQRRDVSRLRYAS